MTTINRRRFLELGGIGATAVTGTAGFAFGAPATAGTWLGAEPEDGPVRLVGDGVGLDTAQYTRLLARLTEQKAIAPDTYSRGGVIEELEEHCARVLGKERAIFMPTGTLANHLAIRALSAGPSRVLVQEQSHLYNDEGDCAQTLSNLTLMPLAPGRATFTANDVQRVIDETKTGRVMSRVSVISLETPVRRRQGERFDSAEMQKIVTLARSQGIRLHLDGARLFLQAAYTGENVAETARPFDTVYVSLYKYFNAASGAILAGPRDLLEDMHHPRRMFGGGLSRVWPFAAVALHYLQGFGDRYSQAVRTSEAFIGRLQKHDRFVIERMPLGTNLFRLRVRTSNPAAFQQRLAKERVMLSEPQGDTFLVGVNETLNRVTANELAEKFISALA